MVGLMSRFNRRANSRGMREIPAAASVRPMTWYSNGHVHGACRARDESRANPPRAVRGKQAKDAKRKSFDLNTACLRYFALLGSFAGFIGAWVCQRPYLVDEPV